jgi:alpha-beta hydrolase superfamily lysophospholipase
MDKFSLTASDGHDVACFRWLVDNPRAAIQIAHGMGEHAQRYDRVAQALNAAGYSVYANDHRGHGITGQEQLGYMGGDGWNRVLADAYELNRAMFAEYPDVPLILLGHSMGSMMAQQYITRYGCSIHALVLSGSPGFKAFFPSLLSRLLAGFESWRLGPGETSTLMQRALFGDANKPFDQPDASGFEWLSRDTEQVQMYIDDEACGFVLSNGSLVDLFAGSKQAAQAETLANIPQDLPIYVFSGSEDPVHGGQKDIQRMLQAFYDRGLGNIEVKWYPGGRHEMFNETNSEEVLADLVLWLGKVGEG